MMFCYKVHQVSGKKDVVLAICDKELSGKIIREYPPFKVSEKFYGENTCGKKEILEKMKGCTIINIVGKKIVDFCIEKNFITRENVILIGDIPHAQIVK
jgi:hypothetical protein